MIGWLLNGIVSKLRTGTSCRDVPERFGSWQTLHTRFHRWALDGTFWRMLHAVQAEKDAAGDIDWLVSVDSTELPPLRQDPRVLPGRRRHRLDPALDLISEDDL